VAMYSNISFATIKCIFLGLIMDIKSIKTNGDVIEFAQEEFARQGFLWDDYEIEGVIEITHELILKHKLSGFKPGWKISFFLKLPPGYERKYIFLDIDVTNETYDIVKHI
jgi:hypothetical protein